LPLKIAEKIDTRIRNSGKVKNDEVLGKEISVLVDDLVIATQKIEFSEDHGKTTIPVYGPLRQGFGTFARRTYMEAPLDKGSEPTVSNTAEFELLNIRRKGHGALFVKGHLLNENLGGPGNTWKNLTPITQQANSDHKNKFENPLKLAVNNTTSGYATKKSGFVRNFSVQAMFNREIDTGLINKLEDRNTETEQVPGFPENTDPFVLAKILRAEQFVSESLQCSATIGEIQKGGVIREKVSEVTIVNEINHGVLSNYLLIAKPRTIFDLKERFSEGFEKSVDHLMKLVNDRKKAEALHRKLDDIGYIPNFKSVTGMTKKELEFADKNQPWKILNRKN
jgi:hypothetical protein